MFELDAVEERIQNSSYGYTEFLMRDGTRLVQAATRPINYQMACRADSIITYFRDGSQVMLKVRFKGVR